ncbi:tripartite-type tricarboxylate transporter receptor subunit TctC [Anaerosolibacter carboniphilus]|uniref:Tripartite-type tricarboxylate transporter receptor subunit TctC n=1 Tax=Anaerosolibacter carboniphilus TaxID=1417629 RepID=A0A841KPX7_9FIRM|nr:tripartite tricarboxylate transporter substrate binding protein [Anaerosolibacter carboniphilus]MBB6214150.1 tripartite-type tricarboxylate transporter receptor subunit TctC [Anaerosolibacter carboniphilus]
MKKRFVLFMSLFLVLSLALMGCAPKAPAASKTEGSAEDEFKFERKIELVCPWGAGGGADSTLRAFASALEKEIGVPVVVNNVEGGGGVKGVEYSAKQPADGYTYMLGTQSLLLVNMQKLSSVDIYKEFIPVTKLVHDTNVIVASSKAPYTNFDELVEYIKANPGKVKCGVMTITGVDAFTVRETFEKAGVDVPLVAFNNGAELNAAIIGGHVDLATVGPAEVKGLVDSGDMRPIIVASEKRLPMIPDVEATGEKGIESYLGPMRGIFAKQGTPEAAIKAFEAAAAKAHASAEFQEWMKTVALDQRAGYANAADFQAIWTEQNETLTELFNKYNK